jgi:tetratricopeptide (TPR) repeat protein
LGDFKGAVKAFETAISRDDELWWSYEWLAKSLYQFESKSDGGGGGGSMVEKHLERAIELNPQAYQAQAFIGEILHLEGKTSLALKWLERSISLRIDQPQVHARLAFIANEKLNPSTAEKHFRLVLSTRSTGRVDESCPVSLEAVNGVTPYLSLYFVVPAQDKEARLQVLETALSEYPHDDLVQLLYAVASSSPSVSSSLEARSDRLKKRSERFPQDTFAKGLYALSLLALGEHGQAGEVYSSFWSQVGGGERGGREHVANGSEEEAGKREEKRKIAFLVMAFWEIKNLSASRITKTKTVETISPTTPPVKTREDRKQKTTPKKVTGVERLAEEEEMKPAVAVRRSSRLSRTN